MLKKVLMSAVLGSALLISNQANADVNAALANICDIVKSDDKGELRKKMRSVQSDFNLKLRDYYDGITCNGKSLIKLAILNDSVEAGTLLVKKMPKKLLKETEHDGSTLQAWIADQGLESSPLVAVLNDRL